MQIRKEKIIIFSPNRVEKAKNINTYKVDTDVGNELVYFWKNPKLVHNLF